VIHRLLVSAFLLAAILPWSGRADGQQDTTPIFVCGEDEKIPAIPFHWTNVILAGDGRLYSPCPSSDHTPDHREVREAAVIGEGRYSADGNRRWRGAQAVARNSTRPQVFPFVNGSQRPGSLEFVLSQLGGLGGLITGSTEQPRCMDTVQVSDGAANPRRWQPGRLFVMLEEFAGYGVRSVGPTAPLSPDFHVLRRGVPLEAAYAIGVQLSRPGVDANVVRAATAGLRECLNHPKSRPVGEVAHLVLEALGVARYEKDADVTVAENFLTQESHGIVLKTLAAVKGFEALLRQHPQHQIGDSARARLRQLVTYGDKTTAPNDLDAAARIRRLALMALQQARDLDAAILRVAATDGDWQMRRIVAGSLNLSDPQMANLGKLLAADPAFQVRYESLGPLARQMSQTRQCAPVAALLNDPSPIVAMRAIDLLSPTCTDIDAATAKLAALADDLAKREAQPWQISSRALTTLARIRPAEARPHLEVAVKHLVWQVRAAAAAMSVTLADEQAALVLSRDPEPNVRTAALDALFRQRSPAVVPRAIDTLLHGDDYQLLRTAAQVLRGLPADAKDDASNALLAALQGLTAQEADTSSDTRIAMLDRLAETLSPTRARDLLPFVVDYDDEVKTAAIKAYTALTHAAPPPSPLRRRYPYQPPASALLSLPSEAFIQLEEGTVILRLLADVAPVTVARFAALATQGYYNGLTFHRIVPNFVVQGGSPGANDYAGVKRFMRDEIGPQGEHVRGAVGMSTRGTDAGDGQFFIDLVDLPHLDRTHTVFAYVTQGMEYVDRLLEGGKIVRVTVK
jgi:peptidyl-prolyl cis-trans isomerase B (cyclophilin B)